MSFNLAVLNQPGKNVGHNCELRSETELSDGPLGTHPSSNLKIDEQPKILFHLLLLNITLFFFFGNPSVG